MHLVNLPGIVQVNGHPANAYPDRFGYLHEGIVVHTMAGSLAGCDSWFANAAAQAGTHFGVGRNGEVHQYFDLTQGPFAHGRIEPGFTARLVAETGTDVNPNWYLIGIEHDDLGTGAPPTEKQLEASAQLSAVLFREHILPNAGITGAKIDSDHILRHTNVSPESRPFCPGWPQELLNRYIRRVQELASGAAPSGGLPASGSSGSSSGSGSGSPAPGAAAVYSIRPGDTLGAIAARFGVGTDQLLAANPEITNPNVIRVGQRLTIPGRTTSYTVQSGDTFGGIAASFRVDAARLLQANPQITDPNLIRVGQQLVIPLGS